MNHHLIIKKHLFKEKIYENQKHLFYEINVICQNFATAYNFSEILSNNASSLQTQAVQY